jgi:hypothetical protein
MPAVTPEAVRLHLVAEDELLIPRSTTKDRHQVSACVESVERHVRGKPDRPNRRLWVALELTLDELAEVERG